MVTAAHNSEQSQRSAEPWVLAASILGSSMAFIDGTVVNVALPVLQKALGATAIEVQWVVESYALCLASLLLLGGALADRLGRRRIFALGVSLFTLASIGCAVAPTIRWLIAARALQGIGGALLVPTSLALLGASFPPERRGRAIGRWSAFSAAAGGIGPVLGGWLIQVGSWRWAFWINVPIAAVCLGITWRRVPQSRAPDTGHRLDLVGAGLATLGLGSLVFGLLEAPRLGFGHPVIIGALAGAVVILAAFVLVEARSPDPMLPLDLFHSRTFSGSNLVTLLLYAALGGLLFFLPFLLIQVHQYSPLTAGAAFLPFIVLMTLLSGRSGSLVDRYGARTPLIVGPLIAAIGFALLALPGTGGSYWKSFFPGVTVLGLGMAITVAPLTTAVMMAAGPERAGLASGVNNAVARTAGLLAIAVFGIVIYARFSGSLARRLDQLGVPPEVRQLLEAERGRLAAARIPSSLPPGLRKAIQVAIDGAFVDGFRLVVVLAAGLALVAAVIAWWLITSGNTAPSTPLVRSSGAGYSR